MYITQCSEEAYTIDGTRFRADVVKQILERTISTTKSHLERDDVWTGCECLWSGQVTQMDPWAGGVILPQRTPGLSYSQLFSKGIKEGQTVWSGRLVYGNI